MKLFLFTVWLTFLNPIVVAIALGLINSVAPLIAIPYYLCWLGVNREVKNKWPNVYLKVMRVL